MDGNILYGDNLKNLLSESISELRNSFETLDSGIKITRVAKILKRIYDLVCLKERHRN